MNKKKSSRSVKWGIWLKNFTSRKDDEWIYVWAKTQIEAHSKALKQIAKYPYVNRFEISNVLLLKDFRKFYPITKVDLK